MNNPDPPEHQQPPRSADADAREMYKEIATLIGTLAKTFGLSDGEAAAAIESGALTLAFAADAKGNRFVAATYAGKTARLYQGAVKHDEGTTPS